MNKVSPHDKLSCRVLLCARVPGAYYKHNHQSLDSLKKDNYCACVLFKIDVTHLAWPLSLKQV